MVEIAFWLVRFSEDFKKELNRSEEMINCSYFSSLVAVILKARTIPMKDKKTTLKSVKVKKTLNLVLGKMALESAKRK